MPSLFIMGFHRHLKCHTLNHLNWFEQPQLLNDKMERGLPVARLLQTLRVIGLAQNGPISFRLGVMAKKDHFYPC